MQNYFARHEVDSKAEGWRQGEDGYPSAGRIAWALWGGDPARRWVDGIMEREDVQKGLFGYPAGKHVMSKGLAAMIPEHKIYVEPFIGSGAVLFAKEKSDVEVVNDYDKEVADAWRILSKLTDEQIKKLQRMDWVSSRDKHRALVKSKPTDDLKKLHRFLYTSAFSFGRRRAIGYATDTVGKRSTIPEKLQKLAPRYRGVKVYNGDYEKVCKEHDGADTFFFLDPPYVGYATDVGEGDFDEERFFRMLKSLKGKWLVTYGVKGKLPKLLRAEYGITVKRWDIRRGVNNTRGGADENKLGQIIAYNYDPPSRVSKSASNVLCFYHRDLDGVASAAIVSRAHPNADIRSINYGEEFPWDAIEGRDMVYMVDFALQPFDGMQKLKQACDEAGAKLVWIDHHVESLKHAEAAGFECDGLRKVGDAGCELTWKYLFPDEEMPTVIRYAGRFDVWDHSDPNTILVHYAMEAINAANDPTSLWWDEWLQKDLGGFEELIEAGQAIQAWLEQHNSGWMRHASFTLEFEGLKCVAANTSIPGSMQYESVKEEHDAAVSFHFNQGNQWDVGMYALKDGVDVGTICDKHGGGGHQGAGGFQAKKLPFGLPASVAKADQSKPSKVTSAEQVQPSTVFAPMTHPAENEYTDVKELVRGFGSAEALKSGIGITPIWGGRWITVQHNGSGKVTLHFGDDSGDSGSAHPEILAGAVAMKESFVFVGELLHFDDGGRPLPPGSDSEGSGAKILVNDVLYWRGKNTATDPWTERQKYLSQALPKAVGPFVPAPSRLAQSENNLKAGVTWADKIPGAIGARLALATSSYKPGFESKELATVELARIANVLVIGKAQQKDGQWIYKVAIGPLSESEARTIKDPVSVGDRQYAQVGETIPAKIAAETGDVLRVEVGEILGIDSDDAATIALNVSKVLERVRVRPATVAEIRALAHPHEVQKRFRIIKRDAKRHYILSVALEPNDGAGDAPLDPDAQNHIYSADEVWDAAVTWYENGQVLGVQHDHAVTKREMLPIHSIVMPVDVEIEGEHVRAGTWLVGSLVLSASLWNRVENGELAAWSVEGDSLLRPEGKKAAA